MSATLRAIFGEPPPPPPPAAATWPAGLIPIISAFVGGAALLYIAGGATLLYLARRRVPAVLRSSSGEAAALAASFSRIIADESEADKPPAALERSGGSLGTWHRRLSAASSALVRTLSQLSQMPESHSTAATTLTQEGWRQLKSTLSSLHVPAEDGAEAKAGAQQASNAARPVLRELASTEADYVNDLRTLAAGKAAVVAEGLLPPQKAQRLFGNADVLLHLHEEFLTQLEQQQSGAAEPTFEAVARAFASLAPYFRLYGEYAKGYFTALEYLQELRANGKGGAPLQRRLDAVRGKGNTGLDALLIKPVQRLTKYPLLLRELLGRLPSGHPQRAALDAAAAEIGATNAEVNARVARAEAAAQLMQAHAELGDESNVLLPSRTLRLTADVTLGTAGKVHRLYLFSDAALLAAPRRASVAAARVSQLFDGPRRAPPRFAARRWLALPGLRAAADGASLALSEVAICAPAPPPAPPLVLQCASSSAAAEVVGAIDAAQTELRSLKSGYKRASPSVEAGGPPPPPPPPPLVSQS